MFNNKKKSLAYGYFTADKFGAKNCFVLFYRNIPGQ